MGSDAKVSKIKLPKVTQKKLRDTPADYRVLLRMVTLSEQRQSRVSVKALAEATHIKTADVVAALAHIFANGWATILQAHSPVDFEFKVPAEVLAGLRGAAATYRQHLEAVERKLAQQKEQQKQVLPKFTAQERAPFMEEAAQLAAQLNHTDIAVVEKVANCMARLGREEVRLLVSRALAEHGEHSPRSCFFKLYTDRRALILYNAG